jgi:hypothetical protein
VALSGTRTATLNVLLPATTQLYILLNDTTGVTYNVTFQISGSAQTPIVVGPGSVSLILSDGNFLYIISQTTTTVFFAQNGSAAAPSYSFINDIATGLYLDAVNRLGISANGTGMMLIDNTTPLDPQVSTPATFTAINGIKGGTF